MKQLLNFVTMENNIEFLKLCTTIIANPYDGNIINLQTFLNSIELIERITQENQNNLALAFLKTKLIGRQANVIADSKTITEFKINLINNVRRDSSELIVGKLLNLRIEKGNLINFAEKLGKLACKLIDALIEEEIPGNKATEIATEYTVNICRSVSKTYLVKIILAASSFKTPEEAIAKFLIETSNERKERILNSKCVSNAKINYNKPFCAEKIQKKYCNQNYEYKPISINNSKKLSVKSSNEQKETNNVNGKNIYVNEKIKIEIEGKLNEQKEIQKQEHVIKNKEIDKSSNENINIESKLNDIKDEIETLTTRKMKNVCKKAENKLTRVRLQDMNKIFEISKDHREQYMIVSKKDVEKAMQHIRENIVKLKRSVSILFQIFFRVLIILTNQKKFLAKKFVIVLKILKQKWTKVYEYIDFKGNSYAKSKPNENIPPDKIFLSTKIL